MIQVQHMGQVASISRLGFPRGTETAPRVPRGTETASESRVLPQGGWIGLAPCSSDPLKGRLCSAIGHPLPPGVYICSLQDAFIHPKLTPCISQRGLCVLSVSRFEKDDCM